MSYHSERIEHIDNAKSTALPRDLPHTDGRQELSIASKRPQNARSQYENFMKTIIEFNKKNDSPILEQPQVENRSINLYVLYGCVLKVMLELCTLIMIAHHCRPEAAPL